MKLVVNGDELVAYAPAKLNLYLEVLGKRADGFHEVETLMIAVRLYDTLRFSATATGTVDFSCGWDVGIAPRHRSQLPQDKTNLVLQAIDALFEHTGQCCDARIRLVKRIPAEAGLGGASSNAAAALVAGNRYWNFGLGPETLQRIGSKIGSDVPFFLQSAPAMCRGRGERIQPWQGTLDQHFVIVKPNAGLSTARVYERCKVPLNPKPYRGSGFFNRLEEASLKLLPELVRLRRDFQKIGLRHHQMTGSGTAYFGVCPSVKRAIQAAQQLRQQGWQRVFTVKQAHGYLGG